MLIMTSNLIINTTSNKLLQLRSEYRVFNTIHYDKMYLSLFNTNSTLIRSIGSKQIILFTLAIQKMLTLTVVATLNQICKYIHQLMV